MKIASTTGDFAPIPADDHFERVRHVAKAGFKYIDLSFYDIDRKSSPFMLDTWKEYVNGLEELAKELGVKYVQSHLPNCNPFIEEQFDEYISCTKRCIEVCGMLGIENAVFHTGWKQGLSKEEYFAKSLETIKPLFSVMEENNVNLLVENGAHFDIENVYTLISGADMKEYIAYVNHPLVHVCWDVGHANIEGSQYDNIMTLGDDLRALHIHDNNAAEDQHMALFTGKINVDEIITALIDSGYKGYFTFEVDRAVSQGETWLSTRRPFEKSKKLFNPPLSIYDATEHYLFEVGKACLEEYNIYEE